MMNGKLGSEVTIASHIFVTQNEKDGQRGTRTTNFAIVLAKQQKLLKHTDPLSIYESFILLLGA